MTKNFCDLCGVWAGIGSAGIPISVGNKLWCGGCHEDEVEKVAGWLFKNQPQPAKPNIGK